jgi:hypothetical protein
MNDKALTYWFEARKTLLEAASISPSSVGSLRPSWRLSAHRAVSGENDGYARGQG